MSAMAKLTPKGQTIPREARDKLALSPGGMIAFEVEGDVLRLRDLGYLRVVQTTLCEWESPEDAEAYDDL
jgi:bifunctional DNA-binding transcriptional regulator/antitoxin component of YhaV-PrlF toxin-antitoxin module